MTEPLLHYVIDADGTLARRVRALSDADRGRVAVFAGSAGNPSRLLEAMGHDIQGPHTTAADLVPWLYASEITDVFIYGVDRVPASRITALAEPAYLTRTRLWLIDAEPGRRGIRRWLRQWACPTIRADAFLSRWPEAPPPPPNASSDIGLPEHLPDCDFLLFAGVARRAVAQPGRAAVLDHYWEAFGAHKTWIAKADRVDLGAVARRAWDAIRENATPQGAQIAVMALQAALWTRGWGFHIDVRRVGLDHAVIGEAHLSDTNSALHRLADTQQATLALLSLLTRAHPAVLAGLRIDDVADDSSAVTIAGERFACPPAAQHILRAHLLRRRSAADGPHLFAHTRNAKPYGTQRAATEQHLQELLYRTARKTGLPLARSGVARAPDSTWIHQRRLRLRRL